MSESEFREQVAWLSYYQRTLRSSTSRHEFLPDEQQQLIQDCSTQKRFEACNSLLESVPLILIEPPVRQQAVSLVETRKEEIAKEEARRAFEASLPKSVLKDKYMLALRDSLANKNYDESIRLFERLKEMDVPLDPDSDFFYGEALYETGQSAKALTVTSRYVRTYGQQANFYQEALQLMNRIESSL